jgi:hypothetical protein
VGQYNPSIDGDLSINCQLNISGLGVLMTVLVSGDLLSVIAPIDRSFCERQIGFFTVRGWSQRDDD